MTNDSKGDYRMSDCLFCKIAKGEIPSTTIFEDDEFRVFLDIYPATKGHALIVTKEHYANIFELPPEVAGRLFQRATEIAGVLKEVLGLEAMNLLQNNGEIAGQTIFHFHLHLIPRYEGDGVKVGWDTTEADKDVHAQLQSKIKERLGQ